MNFKKSDWEKIINQTKQAVGYTPAQIRKNSGQSLKVQSEDSEAFKLKAAEIIAIQQLNQKGLQVVDINTQVIERMENFCVYDGNLIQNLVGSENIMNVVQAPPNLVYDFADPTALSVSAGVVSPYWRSIYVPYTGNFLKVEYLNSRIAVDNSNLSAIVQGISDFSEPQDTSELGSFSSPSTYFAANKLSSDRIIFLDFNNPTGNPIIAKHGDKFETYFSGFWLTFKQNSPRIRVTVGYNSKTDSESVPPENLSLWNGYGLRNNSTINPIPFCITDCDIPNETGPALRTTGWPITATTTEYCLIANPAAVANWEVNGVSICFINNFNASVLSTAATATNHFVVAELYVKTLGTAVTNYLTGSTKIKRILSIPMVMSAANYFSQGLDLAETLRVTLRKNTGLFIRVTRTAAEDNILKFDLSGYSMGPLFYTRLVSNTQQAPFKPRYKYTENPYPIDLDDYGMPLA
jgi:hypothetical protein